MPEAALNTDSSVRLNLYTSSWDMDPARKEQPVDEESGVSFLLIHHEVLQVLAHATTWYDDTAQLKTG
jgi:hypothetical protein